MNAFHIAVENGHLDIVVMLLDAKQDLIHTRRNVSEDRAKFYFIFYVMKVIYEIFFYLIQFNLGYFYLFSFIY